MARNKEAGDTRRVGAVKRRSQIKNKLTGTWTKRDDKTGKLLDVKADKKPLKGVSKKGVKTVAAAARKSTAKKAAKKPAAKKPAKKAAKRAVKKVAVRKKAAKRR